MKKIIIGLIVCFVLATPIKHYYNGNSDYISNHPSTSISDSKQRGIFISESVFNPDTLWWGDKEIIVNESWIEKRIKTFHKFVWIKYRRLLPGIEFCFTLSRGEELFACSQRSKPPFFVIGDHGKGVGVSITCKKNIGTTIFFDTLDETNMQSFKLSLIDSLDSKRLKNITVSINKDNL